MKNPRTWITKLHIRENAVEITYSILMLYFILDDTDKKNTVLFVDLCRDSKRKMRRRKENERNGSTIDQIFSRFISTFSCFLEDIIK